MIYVDGEKCSGCEACLEVCPVEAITMADGKAVIEDEKCLDCNACYNICPQGAIVHSQYPIINPEHQGLAVLAATESLPVVCSVTVRTRTSWLKPVLGYVGSEILPRLMDSFASALDQRLAVNKQDKISISSPANGQQPFRTRQVRRRQRGGRNR